MIKGSDARLKLTDPRRVELAFECIDQKLRHAIDLIVVPAIGEGSEFELKVAQPRRILRKEDPPGLDLGRLV